jgi:hypothetical protein
MIEHNERAETGLIYGEPWKAYRSSGWLGYSALKCYGQSKHGFRERYINANPLYQQSQTRALSIGSLVDDALADNGMVRAECVPPDLCGKNGAANTNAARAWKAQAEKDGIAVVSRTDRDIIEHIVQAIYCHELAHGIIGPAAKQTTARLRYPGNGLPLQCRPDFYSPGEYLADLKTTSESDLRRWPHTCLKYGYHIQGGFYREMVAAMDPAGHLPVFHVVAQTVYPYEVRVYELSSQMLDFGWSKALQSIEGIFAEDWGERQEYPEIVELPAWAE